MINGFVNAEKAVVGFVELEDLNGFVLRVMFLDVQTELMRNRFGVNSGFHALAALVKHG